jgi:hypothetical protein
MICKIYPYPEGDKMPHDVIVNEGGYFEYTPGEGYGLQTDLEL